jgi:sulfur-carrier protein adenylyltransferase/sulfurtransferase
LRPFAGVVAGYGDSMSIGETLEPEQARELIASNEVEVLDIRPEEQWHDKRVPGSRRVEETELEAALEELDEDRGLLIVCEDGEQSAGIAAKLRERGREAGCIEGGINAWEKERLAMQPSSDADDDAKL